MRLEFAVTADHKAFAKHGLIIKFLCKILKSIENLRNW